MPAWSERSICWGSYNESDIWQARFGGCYPETFSDATLLSFCGEANLRHRQEVVLKKHLPLLGAYIGIDAQQKLFDHFVKRRFQGRRGPSEIMRVISDSTLEVPTPEIEARLMDGLIRASRNVSAVFDSGPMRWKSAEGKMCGLTHLLPSETPDMKKALADMKASYKDIFGAEPAVGLNPRERWARSAQAFVAMRNSPYWLALENLLKPNYLGAEWLESWGHDGSASEHVPFPDIDELYYLDEKNHVRAKKRLSDYLDLWSPGWRGSLTSQIMKAFDVLKPAKVAAYSPAAIAARIEEEKKAKAAASASADLAKKQAAEKKLRAQRATLATGGAVVAAGALAYLWMRSKDRG